MCDLKLPEGIKRMPRIKAAAAHVAPVFLEVGATIEKTCSIISEAAEHRAQLVAFPEAYIPAFPVWSALRSPIYNHELFCRLVANSILVDGPEMARLCETAREKEILVSVGFNEATRDSVGCIYNSNVLIGKDGAILNHHRKIMPTFYEKLSWSPGDGAGLRVCDTNCGRVGMLICGENTNPLARYTMMAEAEQVHISTYPPIWPSHEPGKGNYDLAHAIRLRAGAHSFEAKAFNIVSSGFMDQSMFDFLADLDTNAGRILEASPRSVSLITNPSGVSLSEERCDEEGIVYAELDLSECVAPKQFHDVSGGYNRFDIFQLTVNRTPNRPIQFACTPEREPQSKMTAADDGSTDFA
jgi:aliphatic nitrilase